MAKRLSVSGREREKKIEILRRLLRCEGHNKIYSGRKNQNTNSEKYIFLMFYRLCDHYAKLLLLGAVLVLR